MIVHVVRRASRASLVTSVFVATDDERIAEAVIQHGGDAWLTSSAARSGTDRVAEVAEKLDDKLIVNVQGDEPLIEPSTIDAAIAPLMQDPSIDIGTTSEPICDLEEVFNPSVVKVVTDADGFALYFSRSPIPYIRAIGSSIEETLNANPEMVASYRKHSGLYVYRRKSLLAFSRMEPTLLEKLESLEQLRALENGLKIKVERVEHRSIGVDTEQDYERVKRLIEENQS